MAKTTPTHTGIRTAFPDREAAPIELLALPDLFDAQRRHQLIPSSTPRGSVPPHFAARITSGS